MDSIQLHYLSEFNIKIKSDVSEGHKARISSLVKEHKDRLEFIKKYGREDWFPESVKYLF